jgi:predicted dinucleotide-binding enzyme
MFAPNQSKRKLGGEQLTLFVVGDDASAKETVMRFGREIGFDSVDTGY